jgi:hypothetical protein
MKSVKQRDGTEGKRGREDRKSWGVEDRDPLVIIYIH